MAVGREQLGRVAAPEDGVVVDGKPMLQGATRIGLLTGQVEMDEIYLGGKGHNKYRDRTIRGARGKQSVVGLC